MAALAAASTAFAAKPRLARAPSSPAARFSVSCSASGNNGGAGEMAQSLAASAKTFSAALALSSVLLSSAAT
ncbi:hypothetical protein L6232_27480, partial [Shewanella sp. C31]|nr:hypothetical protein [Shewanella electrica]